MKNPKFILSPQSLLYTFLLVTFLFSCQTEIIPEENFQSVDLKVANSNDFYGPAVPFGNGVVRSFLSLTKEGNPVAVGLEISEKALQKLPDLDAEIILELPKKAEDLIIDHIALGWNPMGHEPPGVYDLPHFDMHFYWIPEEDVLAINSPDLAEKLPASMFWPETYFDTPGYVPMMGKHWLSALSPELAGSVFDHTFIYGSYDGNFIFYEPMITWDFLNNREFEDHYSIHQPENFARTGYYYAASYQIRFDEQKKVYRIALTDLFWE